MAWTLTPECADDSSRELLGAPSSIHKCSVPWAGARPRDMLTGHPTLVPPCSSSLGAPPWDPGTRMPSRSPAAASPGGAPAPGSSSSLVPDLPSGSHLWFWGTVALGAAEGEGRGFVGGHSGPPQPWWHLHVHEKRRPFHRTSSLD